VLTKLRDYLAASPVAFTILRRIIELNFVPEKRLIRRLLPRRSRARYLDLGCGTGQFCPLFEKAGYWGIDLSADYLGYANRQNPGHFSRMDATQLAFRDSLFDGVLVMAILHHLDDAAVARLLDELLRVLKPGGRVLVIEDAEVPELETPFVRLVQAFDKGDHIRPPERYKELIGTRFRLGEQSVFRSGGCTYFSVLLET